MSNYMEIKNDNGSVIINDTFENISLTKKTVIDQQGSGTNNDTYKFCSNGYSNITVSTGDSNYPNWYYVLVPTQENIITFVSCLEPTVLVHMNDIYTYEKKLSAKRIEFFIPKDKTINNLLGKVIIYEFSYTTNTKSGSCGIQIFNASNKKIYDTNYKYLNIVNSISSFSNIDGTAFDVDNVAIHYGSMRHSVAEGQTQINAQYYYCIRINENKTLSMIPVRVNFGQYSNNVWGVGYADNANSAFYSPLLIADVTNY